MVTVSCFKRVNWHQYDFNGEPCIRRSSLSSEILEFYLIINDDVLSDG